MRSALLCIFQLTNNDNSFGDLLNLLFGMCIKYFDFISSCQTIDQISLKDLTLRLTFLLCL